MPTQHNPSSKTFGRRARGTSDEVTLLCQGVYKGLHLPSAQLVKSHQNGKASKGASSETFFLYAIPHKSPNG